MSLRRLPQHTLLLLYWMLLLLCVSAYSIPFSTVFCRTRSLLRRNRSTRPTSFRCKDEDVIIKPLHSLSVTNTVYSLLGGFSDTRWTQRRSSSSSLSTNTVKQDTTSNVTVAAVPLLTTQEESDPQSAAAVMTSFKDDATLQEPTDKKEPGQNMAQLHTYHDAICKISLSGLNVSKRKFAAWVQYTLNRKESVNITCLISTRQVAVDDVHVRQELRQLWKQGRLLTDRTEVLAVYKSEQSSMTNTGESTSSSTTTTTTTTPRKRGGFSDLLHIYAERLSAIIEDETEEFLISHKGKRTFSNRTGVETETLVPPDVLEILDGGLLGWLKREYGEQETLRLCFATMKDLKVKEQHEIFQHFLEWFRSRFPYYYDRCDSCGASVKEDPEVNHDASDNNDEDDTGSFLGYVYPSEQELLGKASRTEIYQCHKCGSFTRFPRYNAACSVIQNRRGRCGEYSMLLFRILRATGHTSRWIVDWADHVWAEVLLNDTWIHLDPCEAAVNRPLLYEEWGKQQTYIVAFHAPLANGGSFDRTCILKNDARVPLIEDVTLRYTSAKVQEIQKRRDESDEELQAFVDRTIADLKQRLDRILKER